MINKRKVRLMARTAMYEKHEGHEDFAKSKYLRLDYVSLHMWTTAVAVTVSYILILILLAIYNFEYLVSHIMTMNYTLLAMILIVIYLAMLAIFLLIAFFVFSYRFTQAEEGIETYQNRLKKILKINKEDRKRKASL